MESADDLQGNVQSIKFMICITFFFCYYALLPVPFLLNVHAFSLNVYDHFRSVPYTYLCSVSV